MAPKKSKAAAPVNGQTSLLSMFKASGVKSKEVDRQAEPLPAVAVDLSHKETALVQDSPSAPAENAVKIGEMPPGAAADSNAHAAIDLAKAGSWTELYALLDSDKALVNIRPDVREYAVLHQAACLGNAEAVDVLLDKYASNIQILTKSGETALDIAREHGHDNVVKQLMARMKGSSKEAQPPLKRLKSTASATGSSASCSSTSKKASNIGKAKSSGSAMSPEAVDEELLKKAHSAIDLAKAGKWEELLALLAIHKEVVNVRPEVRELGVLHQVAFHGDEDVLNTLIDKYGADPKMRSKFGATAVDIAKENGHHQLAENLASRCSPKMFSRFDDLTPEKESKRKPIPVPPFTDALLKDAHGLIDLAKEASWPKLYKFLDARPELINVRPEAREYGVLHQAVFHGDEGAVKTLITKYGADPEMRTRSGNTTAFIATMQGHAEIAMSLDGKLEDAVMDDNDEEFDFKQMPDGSWKVVAATK